MANFTLTVGADTVVGGAADDTVNGTAATLNAGDGLTGGTGTDTLALNGGGTFLVDQLATFTGFEIIRLGVVGYQSTNLYLGSQSVAVIADGLFPNVGGDRGQNAVRVYLGSGAVTCGGTNFVYSTSASNWNGHNSIDGGSIYLNTNYSDGAYDLTTNTLSNINYLFFYYSNSENLTVQINSAVAVGVSNFWASPAAGNPPVVRNAQLVTSDAALDLSHSALNGFTVASTNGTGTNFTVRDIATAYQIAGGPGTDTLTAQGFAFSAAQRNVIFATASVEKIVDASGTYTLNVAPTITSNGSGDTAIISIAENTTAVTTVTATDPDNGQTLSYSISGGADGAKFTINGSTGVLSFVSPPNFEAPTDAGGNNVYDVTVQVSDGNGGVDTQAIAVTVIDQNEAPTFSTVNIIRVSTGAYGTPSISGDGRYVAFASDASNLVPDDTNNAPDVFVRDLQTGAITRVSTDVSGGQGNGVSYGPHISADGRYVAFNSDASNLVPGYIGLFVRDLQTGAITWIANGLEPSFSADGRYVAFASSVSNLVPDDTNFTYDVFVRDLQTGATTSISTDANGKPGNQGSGGGGVSISADGRYVAFASDASNLVPDDTNGTGDVFVRDMQTGAVRLVSTDANGHQGDHFSVNPSISADGRYVVFYTQSSNLVPGDTNNAHDVFVQDMQTGAITRVSTDVNGGQGNSASYAPSISADGRYVAFTSDASNLVPGDTNGNGDMFVRDLQTGAITRISTDVNGNHGAISADGHHVAFFSNAVPNPDVFVASIGVVSISENSTAVTTVAATDPDAGQTLSYTISGGADASKFTIGSSTGAVSFISAPNFELPTDAGANNIYDVTVQVSDGHGGVDTQAIAVAVQNMVGVTINGTPGDDVIDGTHTVAGQPFPTNEEDTLNGGIGADAMSGGDGNDVYFIDNVSDVVVENPNQGNDTAYASVGYVLAANVENLVLQGSATYGYGNGLANFIYGTSADNLLEGLAGADTMFGGDGNDTYSVDNIGDVLVENSNEGNDSVFASANYRLPANVENLRLFLFATQGYGNDLANYIYGNDGADLLNGGAGADTMVGGNGGDTYFVDNAGDVVVENADEGTDTVFSTAHLRLTENVENLVLQGSADLQGYGNSRNNLLCGNSGNNILNGDAGADAMFGGAGNDAYFVDYAGDVVVENANEGTDTVFSTAHLRLFENVEYLVLQGSANLQGYGNGLSNGIYGNSGSNILDGGAGADVMVGGAGNDAYFVDYAGDVVVENANEGTDTVFSTAHLRLTENVENLVLQGSADLQGYGNSLNNLLYGNSGNNILNGDAGADAMFGGAGNDAYFVDYAGDVVVENANEGTDTVFSTTHLRLTENVENLVLQGSADLQGYGNSLSNKIYGNAGNNVINGGAGADMLTGGPGNDAFVFDVGQAAGDTIMDFAGNGGGPGDWLLFIGYGPGATFTNIDTTHWQVNYNGGTAHDVITFMSGASINPTDFAFM
jgi:Tol biopolymer transport system component